MRPVPILLVGTFHMANPGADLANVQVDDVLAPGRQQELESVVDALVKFRPSKVLVEHPYDDVSLGQTYTAFVKGQRTLGASEIEQLGFRIAAACGHVGVYPIDIIDSFYEDSVERLIEDPAHAARWQELLAAGEQSVQRTAAALGSGSVGDALRVVNHPDERAAALAPYLESLLPIAGERNWAGPEMVANWYRRNFKIAANVHALADDGDRLMVIYGAGHVPVLEHCLQFSSRFELVDPFSYLSSA